MLQFRFRPLSVRYVQECPNNCGSSLIGRAGTIDLNIPGFFVCGNNPEFIMESLCFAGHSFSYVFFHKGQIFRMSPVPRSHLIDDFIGPPAPNRGKACIGISEYPILHNIDADTGFLSQIPEFPFRLAEGIFRQFTVRNILADTDSPCHISIIIQDRVQRQREPYPSPLVVPLRGHRFLGATHPYKEICFRGSFGTIH
ncbi:MAG: hypothetical protein A4E58_01953 [Syntrophorhabdus sp. PtaB.Bin006]|nr:MAG: hypothetical protein A4E58_01953 [Syntrophorhabdus sp. PtaB.Bin006]